MLLQSDTSPSNHPNAPLSTGSLMMSSNSGTKSRPTTQSEGRYIINNVMQFFDEEVYKVPSQ
jgi:hypothetical protein